jgi:tetratricopeptide (TPR) repeat protein
MRAPAVAASVLTLILVAALVPAARAGEAASVAEAEVPSDALSAARADYLSGKYEKAEEALRRLTARPEADAAAARLLVRLLMETGRTGEAKDLALKLHSENPRDSGIATLAGEARLARYDLREAEELFTKALAADPECRRARVFLKRIYDLTGRADESERIVDYFWEFNNEVLRLKDDPVLADFVYVAEATQGYDAATTKVAFRHFLRAHSGDLRRQQRYAGDPDLHEAYLGAGNLAIEVFDWARAEREFKALLERNPSHPGAHLGLARIYLAAPRNKEAEDAAKKALETNPSLAGARVVLASLHLVDDRLADARSEIDLALRANPLDPEVLSIDATWKLASGDEVGFEAAVKRTLGLYPSYSEVRIGAASVLERRRRFPEALAQYRKAVELDPEGWAGHYGVGMTLVRMGEEHEGYAALETAFELNGFNVWAYNTLVAMDGDFKDGKLALCETEHFVIKLTRTQDEILGTHLEEVLERIWEEETKRFDFRPRGPEEFGRKILFEMFASHEDFSSRTTGIPNLGALGATLGQVVTMPSPSWGVGIGKPFRWTEVARHEFGHVITLQLTEYRIPRWFTEGISVFIEKDPMPSWDPLLARAANEGEIVSLERLNSLFTRPESPSDFALGYYLATLVVEYLVEEHGFEVILEACDLFRKGKSSEDVMTQVSGLTAAEFDGRIQAYVRDHVERTKAWAPPGKKEMERLRKRLSDDPADAEARARTAEGLIASFRYDEAAAEAKRALSDAGGKLARAHVVLGLVAKVRQRDNDAAVAHFRDAARADADDFFAQAYLGLALREAMELEEAARALERAHELNPRFSEPVPAWGAESLAGVLVTTLVNLNETARAAEVAARAATTVPDDWRSAKMAASLLLEDGKAREAAGWLERVLEVNPFDAESQLMFAETSEKLARGREKRRTIELAARAFRAAKALAPREAKAYLGLARTLAALGRHEEARTVIEKLREFDPENEEAARIEQGLR